LDILAQQIAQDMPRDPNQYREIDSELRPHLIEYLALLELELAEYELRAIESPSPSDVARTATPAAVPDSHRDLQISTSTPRIQFAGGDARYATGV
jgi:hypothetical protein